MAQKQLIAGACQRVLAIFKLLLRGAGSVCAAIGSLLLTVFSLYKEDETDHSGLSEEQRIIRDSDVDGSRSHLYDHKLY